MDQCLLFRPVGGALRVLPAAALSLLAAGAWAQTLTPGPTTVTPSNLGVPSVTVTGPAVTTQTSSTTRDVQVSTIQVPSSEVVIEPTLTTPGLRYLYSTPVTTTTWLQDSTSVDSLEINVLSTGTNASGGKYISILGSVTSGAALDLTFTMEASGTFVPGSTPFGTTVPALASFYFGPNALSVSPVPGITANADLTSLTYDTNTFTSTFGTTTFSMTPATVQPFAAYVYAGSDVTIDTFDLFGVTTSYGLTTTPQQQIVIGARDLVGAEQIAPIPSAEPVLILAAGLGFAAAVARRRRRGDATALAA
jgi:hypothetical protein